MVFLRLVIPWGGVHFIEKTPMNDVKTPDLWLMHGDCLDRMKEIPDCSVDTVIIDPPYGINFQSQWKKNKDEWIPKIKNDKAPFTQWVSEAFRVMKDKSCMICFMRWDVQYEFHQALTEVGFKVKEQLIWDKMNHGTGDLKGAPGCRHEMALFATKGRFTFKGKRPQSLMQFKKIPPQKLIHPNEKPIQLMDFIVNHYSGVGDLIADFTTGVSPVGVASIRNNRKFIGIELDEKYFEIAKNRILSNTQTPDSGM